MSNRLPETELSPLSQAPPNLAALAAGPFVDGVHVRLKLNFDVTHLDENQQKLLLFMVTNATKQMENHIKGMNKIEVASKLGRLERAKGKSNGT